MKKLFRNFLKSRADALKDRLMDGISMKVVDEQRTWYKNGNHKLSQRIAFHDESGQKVGSGKITRHLK